MTEIFIDNAIKYSIDSDLIKIELLNKNKPTLSFHNKTKEITEENKERLFNRFYRNDASRSRETGGSGLGLPIVKTIIDNNNWDIKTIIEKNESVVFVIRFK